MGQHADDLMFQEMRMFGANRYEINLEPDYEETNPFLHHTKDGKTMLINEMTDSHLINTIKFKLRHIENKSSSYNFHFNRLPYYFFEAILRDIDIEEFKRLFINITTKK